MKQLGEWWINFLDQREIFSMSSSPLGRESSTRWKGWKEKWLHIHHSFPSKHCNTNYSFDHFIKPLVYPMDIIQTIRTWRCILLLPLVGNVTNTQPYLKPVPSTVSRLYLGHSGSNLTGRTLPMCSHNGTLSSHFGGRPLKYQTFGLEPATMFTDKHLEFGIIEIESAQYIIWRENIPSLFSLQLILITVDSVSINPKCSEEPASGILYR